LGETYEALGQSSDALKFYLMAMPTSDPDLTEEVRELIPHIKRLKGIPHDSPIYSGAGLFRKSEGLSFLYDLCHRYLSKHFLMASRRIAGPVKVSLPLLFEDEFQVLRASQGMFDYELDVTTLSSGGEPL
jgi:hypothetical protein